MGGRHFPANVVMIAESHMPLFAGQLNRAHLFFSLPQRYRADRCQWRRESRNTRKLVNFSRSQASGKGKQREGNISIRERRKNLVQSIMLERLLVTREPLNKRKEGVVCVQMWCKPQGGECLLFIRRERKILTFLKLRATQAMWQDVGPFT